MEETRSKQISDLVKSQMPEFVRIDHPTIIAFLEAYYEWLQQDKMAGKILSPMVVADVIDIDDTMDRFLDHFKKQYLHDFPEQLAISKATGKPVDVRKLAKHIKAFYRAKGTEKAYEFLFRILYDVGVEFYYPKRDILRVSDGKWNEKTSIKVTNALGNRIFESLGRTVYQKNSLGEIVSSARVIDVSVYQEGIYDVAELTLTARNGNFSVGSLGILFDSDTETLKEIRIYSVISSVGVTSAGTGYAVGDEVTFTPVGGDVGFGGRGVVSSVNSTGGIRKIRIENFGINYSSSPSITINSLAGSGFVGTANIGTLCQAEGYYLNNDGRLSTNKVLQDNHYYQDYSYVLKTEIVVDQYREILRRLIHPAGTAMFGQVLIKRCSKENLNYSSSLIRYEVPIIGHYAPYTFQTFDNLQDWFLYDFGDGLTSAGYIPVIHDKLIQNGTGTNKGNPITNRVKFVLNSLSSLTSYRGIPARGVPGLSVAEFGVPAEYDYAYDENDLIPLGLAGFKNADPFWIIYEHPNRKILAPTIAQVWRDQLDDFVAWPEWSSVTGGSAPKGWTADFYIDSPVESKYAFLKYDTKSAFRKITARSFFEMPIGLPFDCRLEGDIPIEYPSIQISSPTNLSEYDIDIESFVLQLQISNLANNDIIPILDRIQTISILLDSQDITDSIDGDLSLIPGGQIFVSVPINGLISLGVHRLDVVPLNSAGRRCSLIPAASIQIVVSDLP